MYNFIYGQALSFNSQGGTTMKRGYADTPHGQIHYMTMGEGEPLLLLHQTGSSRQYWKLMPLLAGSYRTFAPDGVLPVSLSASS